ncbi:BlaI/MecI/CopY family transcriptional regulator [Fimbriiglobus ruber]|uniref:Transcriptional repressor, BlaI/MecI family n=1 Tax=Fimbriiglobus ruber TaxID=1908690 RepID=A0A225DG28_9BACT|nr:BlaI/MecI/CopY family transcriptional regulator [Fimbriiglobus ruber]OWK36119.1 Transcriptional repressor, BlaI/MecI family [Fimbriiglobus ruber]
MAARPSPDVTDAELRVLEALWEHGPSPIRKLTDHLYPGGGSSSYATVQKLLERLEEEGCVTRDRTAMTHVFTALIGRDTYISEQLRSVADRLCGGAMTPLLTHLLKTATLADADRKELRKLLNAHRPPGRK